MTRLETRQPPPNLGGHATESEALKEMVGLLIQGLKPKAIYLFGSRARLSPFRLRGTAAGRWGNARPDSDFDLMVVIPRDPLAGRCSAAEHREAGDDAVDYDRVYAPLRRSRVGCDVVPVSEEGFAEDRDDL